MWRLGSLLLLSLLLPPQLCSAQDADPVLVTEVLFSGDTFFRDTELRGRVRTAPNRRVLGIRGFHWWRWIYQLGASGALGTRVGNALKANGEPPAWLDTTVLSTDAEQLRLFYASEGFRAAMVTADVNTARGRASVMFNIKPGPASVIRHVSYTGLDALSGTQEQAIADASLIVPPAPDNRGTPESLRFSEPLLVSERRRLLDYLRNNGFATVTRDSIRAVVYPAGKDSMDIVLRVNTGLRYRFGAVHFDVSGPETVQPARVDSSTTLQTGITWQIDGDRVLKPSLLLRSLRATPGTWYSQAALLETKRRLEESGVFELTSFEPQVPVNQFLAHRIVARSRQRHRFRMEAFALQSSGVLGGVGSELGGGIGIAYENGNLWGSGELFRVSITSSVAADADSTVFSSAQAELTGSLTFPYLPVERLERALNLHQSRTRLSFTMATARREDLRLIIRGKGTARMRLELRHNRTITSYLDVADISLSSPDTLGGFRERFLDRILGTDGETFVADPVQQARVLEDYTQPQINSAVRYTFSATTVNPLRRSRGHSYEAAIEIGGNLPHILDRHVFTPGILEGSLPALRTGSAARLLYRQYLRLVADIRRYESIGPATVLAWKVVGGWAHPTGKARVMPFDRRFYSGGASSVRGWRLRGLGPGAATFLSPDARTSDGANILGGDIKMEFSVELRQTTLRHVLAASWILAAFADAGNVWFGPRNPGFTDSGTASPSGRFHMSGFYRELGVGTGLGLRINWEYLVARIDFAVRAHDPALSGQGLFPEGVRRPTAYFRIGHAF